MLDNCTIIEMEMDSICTQRILNILPEPNLPCVDALKKEKLVYLPFFELDILNFCENFYHRLIINKDIFLIKDESCYEDIYCSHDFRILRAKFIDEIGFLNGGFNGRYVAFNERNRIAVGIDYGDVSYLICSWPESVKILNQDSRSYLNNFTNKVDLISEGPEKLYYQRMIKVAFDVVY